MRLLQFVPSSILFYVGIFLNQTIIFPSSRHKLTSSPRDLHCARSASFITLSPSISASPCPSTLENQFGDVDAIPKVFFQMHQLLSQIVQLQTSMALHTRRNRNQTCRHKMLVLGLTFRHIHLRRCISKTLSLTTSKLSNTDCPWLFIHVHTHPNICNAMK